METMIQRTKTGNFDYIPATQLCEGIPESGNTEFIQLETPSGPITDQIVMLRDTRYCTGWHKEREIESTVVGYTYQQFVEWLAKQDKDKVSVEETPARSVTDTLYAPAHNEAFFANNGGEEYKVRIREDAAEGIHIQFKAIRRQVIKIGDEFQQEISSKEETEAQLLKEGWAVSKTKKRKRQCVKIMHRETRLNFKLSFSIFDDESKVPEVDIEALLPDDYSGDPRQTISAIAALLEIPPNSLTDEPLSIRQPRRIQ
jgi:hypothetical protein